MEVAACNASGRTLCCCGAGRGAGRGWRRRDARAGVEKLWRRTASRAILARLPAENTDNAGRRDDGHKVWQAQRVVAAPTRGVRTVCNTQDGAR
jgi:hypothetical protein